jgi:hypothetical protein
VLSTHVVRARPRVGLLIGEVPGEHCRLTWDDRAAAPLTLVRNNLFLEPEAEGHTAATFDRGNSPRRLLQGAAGATVKR